MKMRHSILGVWGRDWDTWMKNWRQFIDVELVPAFFKKVDIR